MRVSHTMVIQRTKLFSDRPQTSPQDRIPRRRSMRHPVKRYKRLIDYFPLFQCSSRPEMRCLRFSVTRLRLAVTASRRSRRKMPIWSIGLTLATAVGSLRSSFGTTGYVQSKRKVSTEKPQTHNNAVVDNRLPAPSRKDPHDYEVELPSRPFLRMKSYANVQGLQAIQHHELQGPIGSFYG
jgi:hypothetical protein